MSKSRNLVDLNPDAGGLLPSSNMAAGAAVSNIGYTPVNNAGGTMTGALTATGFTGPLTGNAATATNVAYSGLTGTVPTWNQNTTGNAATATTTTGNAATATALATGRTIALTGDVTYTSPSFTGAANVTAAATLAASGVTAGSYTYASITVDAKGRLTAASSGASPSAFPAGTLMLFVQTAAPTGWTKSTTHDNKALRVVSGTASSGGTSTFTTVFSNQTPTITTSGLSAGATTLSTAQMPSHNHNTVSQSYGGTAGLYETTSSCCAPTGIVTMGGGRRQGSQYTTTSAGSGSSHSHSISGSASSSAITLAVQYVDVIIATKD